MKNTVKKLTKWDIAVMIEKLPGNVCCSLYSLMTLNFNYFSRSELVEIYNDLIAKRSLTYLSPII